MRPLRGLTRAVAMAGIAALVMTVLAIATSAGTAVAADGGDCPPGTRWHEELLTCVQETEYGGQLPSGDTTTIPVVRARGGEAPRCYQDAAGTRREVPCVRDVGVWNGTCYVQQVTDPPPDRRAAFRQTMQGHDDGVVIACYYPLCDGDDWRNDPDADLLQCPTYTWAPNADPVDPAAVAEEIWARLTKAPIDIGVAPYDTPGHAGYVGVPTWYWVEDYSPMTVGPIGDTDSSHGFTVVAESIVDHIEFDLGNGEAPLECPPDSQPFETGRNYWESPDCGWTFEKTGTYEVAATAHWVESWSGLGQVGENTFELVSRTTIQIGENQALRQ